MSPGDYDDSSRKFQALAERLLQDQEVERENIGRELEDDVGSSLTVVGMLMQAAVGSPGQDERIKFLLQSLERASGQLRILSHSLRSQHLEVCGLESGLRWFVNWRAPEAGLKAEFFSEPLEHRLDWVLEIACFRVAQEAMTNVIRHAKASSVRVDLTRNSAQLHLSVRDDGIGFDVAEARHRDYGTGWYDAAGARQQVVPTHQCGLLRMEDQALVLGGGFEVKSGPAQGTEVHAWFPLRWNPTDTTTQA